jgi:uncharacterized protein (TIGR00369 family)
LSRVNPDQSFLLDFEAMPEGEPFVTSNPLAAALGARLRLADREAGVIELAFSPSEVFVQGAGVLQGGAVAAMLDFAMAFAALLVIERGRSIATTNLNISYQAAARLGDLVAIGRVSKAGRSLVFCTGALRCGPGPDLAIASAVQLIVP